MKTVNYSSCSSAVLRVWSSGGNGGLVYVQDMGMTWEETKLLLIKKWSRKLTPDTSTLHGSGCPTPGLESWVFVNSFRSPGSRLFSAGHVWSCLTTCVLDLVPLLLCAIPMIHLAQNNKCFFLNGLFVLVLVLNHRMMPPGRKL